MLELALQQVVNGLLVGAIYALMALGLMVILGILRIINMGQGELYMLGGYFCYLASVTLGVGYVPAIILAMIATAGVGVLMDRLAVRPLLRRPFYMVSLPKTRSCVPVMQPAQDCMGDDVSEALDRAPVRRILSELNMRTPSIVINGEFRKDPPQVLFVEHDQMIGALAPDRSDQALNMAVLPGRAE